MISPIPCTTDARCMTPLVIPPLKFSRHASASEWRSLNNERKLHLKGRVEGGRKKVSSCLVPSSLDFAAVNPLTIPKPINREGIIKRYITLTRQGQEFAGKGN